MEFIRGTTPTIEISITNEEVNLHDIVQCWVYIYQNKNVIVDKVIDDVSFDYDNRKILVTLTQTDTLNLKASQALFQMRLLLNNGVALASTTHDVIVKEVYKEGEILGENIG